MKSKLNIQIFAVIVLATITRCVSQIIQIIPDDKEPVREERSKYGVTCYGPNLQDYQWRGPSGIISQSQQFRVHSQMIPLSSKTPGLLLVFETVMEEDVGNYYCTATGMDGRGHNISIKLTVTKIMEFDAPSEQTTDEYSDFLIKCRVKGNVNPMFMWSFNDQPLKVTQKTSSGKYSVQDGGLLVRNVTHLDAGKYTCRAFETTSKSTVSGSTAIDLKVKHKPTFLTYMEGDPVVMYVFVKDSINLTCHNSAEPPATMSWSFNGKSFIYTFDYYIVTFNSKEKLGEYMCKAFNSLGQITRRFKLVQGFKPKKPTGLTASHIADSYIVLQVDPADQADELIGYQVDYVKRVVEPDSGGAFESFGTASFNNTEGPFTLVSLNPNSDYTMKILAKNRAGQSEFSDPIVVRTMPSFADSGAPSSSVRFVDVTVAIFTILFAARL